MSVTVTLDIYSGLPNPSWELSEEQAAQLVERLQSAEATTLRKPSSLDGRLGYRGFIVESVRERGLEPLTLIHEGLADIDRFVPSRVLPGPEAEQWLLATGAGVVSDELAAYVSTQISGGGSQALAGAKAAPAPLAGPPYNPGKWNNNPTIRQNNNCYNMPMTRSQTASHSRGAGAARPGPIRLPAPGPEQRRSATD